MTTTRNNNRQPVHRDSSMQGHDAARMRESVRQSFRKLIDSLEPPGPDEKGSLLSIKRKKKPTQM